MHVYVNHRQPMTIWIETYEYFDKFINLCTSINVCCILVFKIHKNMKHLKVMIMVDIFIMLV
jgi:hypothetical protein